MISTETRSMPTPSRSTHRSCGTRYATRKGERPSGLALRVPKKGKRSSIKNALNFIEGVTDFAKDIASEMQDGALDALDVAKASKKAAEEEAKTLKEKAKRRVSTLQHGGEQGGEAFADRMKHWKEEHTTNPLH
mmetsp:Transcript_13251/g.35636  ORF Transcript_13251/g.35636 Transcript_13251/m.35636 type:complete len:134 (+) Transcript_13251:219-620(+)